MLCKRQCGAIIVKHLTRFDDVKYDPILIKYVVPANTSAAEDEDSILLQNVGVDLQIYTAQKLTSTKTYIYEVCPYVKVILFYFFLAKKLPLRFLKPHCRVYMCPRYIAYVLHSLCIGSFKIKIGRAHRLL
jgi:hypothetical protein